MIKVEKNFIFQFFIKMNPMIAIMNIFLHKYHV